MSYLRKAARAVPHSWRQRLKAHQIRFTTARQAQPVPAGAHAEAGQTVIQDCHFCKRRAVSHNVVGHVTPTHHGPFAANDYRLVHCPACGVIYLAPQPTLQDLKVLYEGDTQFTDPTYTESGRAAQILNNYQRRLGWLGIFPKAGERSLEVGAGLAWVSRACKQHDSGIVTLAQDVSSEAAAYCPWVDRYVVGTVESLPAEERFQLISMTHVIEHLLEPREMLQQLAGRLAPDGHLFITAPYRPPLWKARDGIGPWLSYSYLHVPGHIAYLSKQWFRESARMAGLKLLRWDPSHDGHQAFEVVLHKPLR